MVTVESLNAYVQALIEEETYDDDEGVWNFRSGGRCLVCTDSASKVAERFGAKVFGFFIVENPDAEISIHVVEGHDFAIISARWLVDYWAYRVAGLISRPVLDFHNSGDKNLVKRLYGTDLKWEMVPT